MKTLLIILLVTPTISEWMLMESPPLLVHRCVDAKPF